MSIFSTSILAMPATATNTMDLRRLPGEIRNMIYSYVVIEDFPIPTRNGTVTLPLKGMPKDLHDEVVSLYFVKNLFVIEIRDFDDSPLQAFLSQVPHHVISIVLLNILCRVKRPRRVPLATMNIMSWALRVNAAVHSATPTPARQRIWLQFGTSSQASHYRYRFSDAYRSISRIDYRDAACHSRCFPAWGESTCAKMCTARSTLLAWLMVYVYHPHFWGPSMAGRGPRYTFFKYGSVAVLPQFHPACAFWAFG